MTLSARPGFWEKLKPQLARWMPLFGYYSAQRVGFSCYHLRRGRIEPPDGIRINATDHCNLSCRDCNHGSPAMPPTFADPAVVYRDCSALKTDFHPQNVKIVGGEPLLHPDLPELLKAVLASGISKNLQLITNGFLLEQMPEKAWEIFDVIEISLYPQTILSPERIQKLRNQAARFRVDLRLWRFHDFRCSFALRGTTDHALVKQIYRNCRLAHDWGCPSIHEGYFYKCCQAIYLPKLIGNGRLSEGRDGVRVADNPHLREELRHYLASIEPLEACRYCLGSVGQSRPHQQASRQEWRAFHDQPTEALIDLDLLRKTEARCPIDTIRSPYAET